MRRSSDKSEDEILAAVRAGDEQGLTREAVAESLGMSPSSLSHFLRARGLANTRTHRDGQPLAAKIVRIAKERRQRLDQVASDLDTTAGHLRRVASGKRGASASLVRSMMLHLYGWSYETPIEDMKKIASDQKRQEARDRREDRRVAAIAAKGEKARLREIAMRDAIEDGVTPADVADRRYHGSDGD